MSSVALSEPTARARLVLLTLLILLVTMGNSCLGGAGAKAEPDFAPAEALRLRFPDQAPAVLAPEDAFVATAEGFVPGAPRARGAWRGVEVILPRDGRGVTRLRDNGGVEVQVRELGVEGDGALAEGAVAYPRAGGTSFWTAVAFGVEEWLHLEARAVRRGEPVAVWQVEGATVRQREDGVELFDARGAVRFSVTAPRAYAAGGREVRARLAAQDARVELWVEAEGEAVLVDPLWTAVAPMAAARDFHTATLLPNGQVLVAGGANETGALPSAELYAPVANTWTSAAALKAARNGHTATLLPTGQVLVVGGFAGGDKGIALSSAELYDPAENGWTSTAALKAARGYHTATLLPTGQALVVGGRSSAVSQASAELYDPATGTWASAGAPTARELHTATLLASGRVLVAGGGNQAGTLASAELYDPATNSWTSAGQLAFDRQNHTATRLASGQVLVVGGNGTKGVLDSAELYDAGTNRWKLVNKLSTVRLVHTATLLSSGEVLVAGGFGNGSALSSAELYDVLTDNWKPAGALATARHSCTATLLPSGQVLAAGGLGPGVIALSSAELYTPPCASSADCQNIASGECEYGLCDITTASCRVAQKLDGTPCAGGLCIAGGCFSGGASSSSSSGSTGAGGAAGEGGSGAPTASSGGTTATGSGQSASASGAGGSAEDLRLYGGGCGVGPGPRAGAPWMGIALLLLRRRRAAGRRRGGASGALDQET
jgi:hypothetical protein